MAQSKYIYNDLILSADNYNSETKLYNWVVKTTRFWTIEFQMKKFDTPKITGTWKKIVGDVILNNGENKGIFENTNETTGKRSFSATIVKASEGDPLYFNITPVISSSEVKSYKVSFVELREGQASQIQAKRDEVEVDF